jgi:hypothetical protein
VGIKENDGVNSTIVSILRTFVNVKMCPLYKNDMITIKYKIRALKITVTV